MPKPPGPGPSSSSTHELWFQHENNEVSKPWLGGTANGEVVQVRPPSAVVNMEVPIPVLELPVTMQVLEDEQLIAATLSPLVGTKDCCQVEPPSLLTSTTVWVGASGPELLGAETVSIT
jgi:hypothetical protein